MPAKPSAPPPSIAHLKTQGLTGVCTFCRACGHSGAVTFDAIGFPELDAVPEDRQGAAVPVLGLRGAGLCGYAGLGGLPRAGNGWELSVATQRQSAAKEP